MMNKSNGDSAEFIKRQAKKLKRELGISHHAALDQAATNAGYLNWNNFIKTSRVLGLIKPATRASELPSPVVEKYHDVFTGKVMGERPNAKMPIVKHSELGALLQEFLNVTAYHKRAFNPVNDIRKKMDIWLGSEYNDRELPTETFNSIYYGKQTFTFEAVPSAERQEEIRIILARAKAIIDKAYAYHTCRPVLLVRRKFELAFRALDKWPTSVKVPVFKEKKKQVPKGTFVRRKDNQKIGLLFHHDVRRGVVKVYDDGGYYLAARHEVSVPKKQIDLSRFKPMRLYLPYGKWICADGTEVLFNRDYCPIWERSYNGITNSINPATYIKYNKTEFYYDDRTAPYYGHNETLSKCLSVLKEWGVQNHLPMVFNLLPAALLAGDMQILSPKGFS